MKQKLRHLNWKRGTLESHCRKFIPCASQPLSLKKKIQMGNTFLTIVNRVKLLVIHVEGRLNFDYLSNFEKRQAKNTFYIPK